MSVHPLTGAGGPGKKQTSESQDRTDRRMPRTDPMSRLPANAALAQPYILYLSFIGKRSGVASEEKSVLPSLLQSSSKTCHFEGFSQLVPVQPSTAALCVH